jgi:periplasmic protein TonB
MNGYKTGGDWTDVTSISRNEVVFEGRHKAYGAYYIRQRYQSALLFALLSAITFMASCAFIAYAFRTISHSIPKTDTGVVIKPREVLIHRDIIVPPITHPPVQPHKTTPNNAPPLITSTAPDSAAKHPDVPDVVVPSGETGTDKGTPDPNPGPGIETPIPPPIDNSIHTWVSEMPKFPGKIEDYLQRNTQYSAEATQMGIQGTVYVSFIIERDGSVSTVKVERGISNGAELNDEAARVISAMPPWTPGKQEGHPVRVQYIVPIHFKLQ